MIPAQSASVHRAVERRDLAAPPFLAAALLLLAMLAWAYGNHFHNPFQFDDSHTIVSNSVIRDLHNVPRFFTDGTTSSTLPTNQAWRPGFTTLNAIDTWLSGGVPNPFWFHVSIFASYVLLGVVLFFVYRYEDEVEARGDHGSVQDSRPRAADGHTLLSIELFLVDSVGPRSSGPRAEG